uniref:Sulfotransferase family protein n=1 Tax=viral metagenome TaxID=1070528 RepID=A0A6C0CJD6_9ZZZZ
MHLKNKYFIHIPRTGGTYVEDSAASEMKISMKWPTPDTDLLFGLYQESPTQFYTLQHLTYTESIDKFGVDESQESFAIVRNPYDRFISLYSFWGGDRKFGSMENFLTLVEQMNINDYDHTGINIPEGQKYNYQTMTHKECVYHFIPQYKYLCRDNSNKPADNIRIFKFGEMESLNPYLGVKSISFRKPNRDVSKLKPDQQMRVYMLYKKDFEIFGYEIPFKPDSEF